MQNMFTQTLDALKEKLQTILEKAYSLETRASILRDLHWGEEDALRRLLPICTEAGDLCMGIRILQDMLGSCGTIAGMEALAARVQDLRARNACLDERILQEEEEARGRLEAVMTRLR